MNLKKLTTILTSLSIAFSAIAAEPETLGNTSKQKGGNDGGKCFDESSKLINIGVGIGGAFYSPIGNFTSTSTPNICISYEQPWSKRLGPGYLGVGGYLGFKRASYTYNYTTGTTAYFYEHSWNYYMVTGRAAYHWDVLNKGNKEIYGGALIGLRMQSYTYSTNDLSTTGNENKLTTGNGIYPTIAAFAGVRWYPSPRFALYSELGSGISFITGGLTFKL